MYCMWIYDYFLTLGDEVRRLAPLIELLGSNLSVGDVRLVREKILG